MILILLHILLNLSTPTPNEDNAAHFLKSILVMVWGSRAILPFLVIHRLDIAK